MFHQWLAGAWLTTRSFTRAETWSLSSILSHPLWTVSSQPREVQRVHPGERYYMGFIPLHLRTTHHLGQCYKYFSSHSTWPLGEADPHCTLTHSSAVEEKRWGNWPQPERGCQLLGWKRSELWMPGSCWYSFVSQAAQWGFSITCLFYVCSVGLLGHPLCSPHQPPCAPSLHGHPSLLESIHLARIPAAKSGCLKSQWCDSQYRCTA